MCSSKYGAHSKLLSAEEVEILLRSARKRQRTNASNEVPVSTEVHRVQPAVEQIQISLMMSRTNEMGSEEFVQRHPPSIEMTSKTTSDKGPASTEVHWVQPAVEQIQISPMMSRTNEMGSEEFVQRHPPLIEMTSKTTSDKGPASTEVHWVQPAVEQIQISPMMSRTNEMGSEEFDESRSRGELSENMNLVSEGNSIFLECGLILVFLAENSNSLPEGMDFDSSDDEENLDSTCEGEFSTLTPLFNHLIFFHLKNSMNLPELEAPLKNLQPLLMRNWRNFKKFSEKMK